MMMDSSFSLSSSNDKHGKMKRNKFTYAILRDKSNKSAHVLNFSFSRFFLCCSLLHKIVMSNGCAATSFMLSSSDRRREEKEKVVNRRKKDFFLNIKILNQNKLLDKYTYETKKNEQIVFI